MGINQLLCVFCLLFTPNLYPSSFDLASGLNNLASRFHPLSKRQSDKEWLLLYFLI